MKSKGMRIALVSIVIALTLAFIWGNSMKDSLESEEQSAGFLEQNEVLLDAVFGQGRITDPILRKAAHFCEFALLGAELRLLFLLLGQPGLQGHANALFASLAAAVADEGIQILSCRGSQVQDVLLDFCGAFAGALVLLLLAGLVRRLRRRKKG